MRVKCKLAELRSQILQYLHSFAWVFVCAERQQLVWSLGNLTLLTGSANASLLNSDFPIKMSKLEQRANPFMTAHGVYTGSIPPGYCHTPADCKKRGELMLK